LRDAPGSHITIGSGGNSNNAAIRHITINTQVPSHNTDGIDVWASHVDIDSCYISDGDDNVAIDRESQYIRITNCSFGYGHGTSVGSYTTNVKHILIDNCTYENTDNGVRLKSNTDRGGGEEDFVFSNLTMNNVKSLIYIDCYYDKQYSTPVNDKTNAKAVTPTTPSFKNIVFKNIKGTSTYKKNNAIFIYGRPELHVRNITFDNVQLTAPTGAVINFADSVVFKNGSSITAGTGNSISSTYDADITWNTTQTSKISASSVPNADHRTKYTTSGKKVLDNDKH
jgi:polygalacturonase